MEEGKSAHTGVCWSDLVLRWCVGGWHSQPHVPIELREEPLLRRRAEPP